MEYQMVGAAARKEREPKIKLVRGTRKRLEEKDEVLEVRRLKTDKMAFVLLLHQAATQLPLAAEN